MKLYALSILFSTKFLPILFALVGFGLLITVHECGHFLFCKLFGIHTPTFSIGMGPTLFKRKIGDTNFRLALIPIGGYVEIAGMAEVGQGDQKFASDLGPRSFGSKPFWQRFLVLVGGILFNLLFAYAVFSSLYMVGMPVQKEVALFVQKVKELKDGTPVDLKVGDKIVEINQYKLAPKPENLFPLIKQIGEELHETKPKWITVGAERDGDRVYVSVPAEINGEKVLQGVLAGATLGLKPTKVEYEKHGFFAAIKHGIKKTNGWIYKVFASLKMLVAKRNIKDFGGPIMIMSESFKRAQQGLSWLFVFLAIISVNLAVINILPIGALDGGQLLFETIEAIIRRKIPYVIRFGVNLASWVLILSLLSFLSYQDIRRAIFGR